MVSASALRGVAAALPTALTPGEPLDTRRGRAFYVRQRPRPDGGPPEIVVNPPLPPLIAEALLDVAMPHLRTVPTEGGAVVLLLGPADLAVAAHLERERKAGAVLRVPRDRVTERVRALRLLWQRHEAELGRRGRGRALVRRVPVPHDVPPGMLWYVPLAEREQEAVARFRAEARARGVVPDIVQRMAERWDPLALLWLEEPALAVRLFRDPLANDATTLPRPGVWPRLAEAGGEALRALLVSSPSAAGARHRLAAGEDLGPAPLWAYLPERWATDRYQGAAWGQAPTDAKAAALARLFPEAPATYAAQRLYALARAVLERAMARAGAGRPFAPRPWSGDDPAARPWTRARPLSFAQTRVLMGVVRAAERETGHEALWQAHAVLCGFFPRVFSARAQ